MPYVYTALYEGGEHTDGVFMTSETPAETGPSPTGRRANGAADAHELAPVGDNEDAALDALMSDDEANLEDLNIDLDAEEQEHDSAR